MDIDTVFAEAVQETANEQEASTEATTTVEEVTTAEPEQEPEKVEVKEDISKKPDSELTPEQLAKRISNKLAHANSEAAKYKRELRAQKELNEQIVRQQQTARTPDNEPKEPNIDDFDTIADYTKAVIKHERSLEKQAEVIAPEPAQQPQQTNPELDHRVSKFDEKAAELAEQYDDFEEVAQEFMPIVRDLPPEHAQLFLKAPNGALAFYVLAQDGKLGDLANMDRDEAAFAIAEAQIRGAKPIKTVTTAPAPISPVRSSGNGGKSLANMDADELYKWVKS